jgi:DNA modification methylase
VAGGLYGDWFDAGEGIVIHVGDCLATLRTLPAESVNCCVTSPPYFGLRDYGHDGQIGLEPTPDEFVAALVAVFRQVRRVLRADGTLWLNLGDSYAATRKGSGGTAKCGLNAKKDSPRGTPGALAVDSKQMGQHMTVRSFDIASAGLKQKDLIGIPWRVAFALQADGWYLRQDIIWAKPNPMPESVRDRCTKSHEYLFLLSKSSRYYFDADAIAEPLAASSVARLSQPTLEDQIGGDRVPGKTNGTMKAVTRPENMDRLGAARDRYREQGLPDAPGATRNKRSVWTVTTKPFKGAHFATFPPDLIEPCILAGCPAGGVVLDPFGGAGTTGVVAVQNDRQYALCELNPKYAAIAVARIAEAVEQRRIDTAQAEMFGEAA